MDWARSSDMGDDYCEETMMGRGASGRRLEIEDDNERAGADDVDNGYKGENVQEVKTGKMGENKWVNAERSPVLYLAREVRG